MIEGVPWPAVGGASAGWLLLFIALYGLITRRWWVTRAEADIHIALAEKAEERAEKAEKLSAELAGQNTSLMESAEITNTVMRALRDEVRRGGAQAP